MIVVFVALFSGGMFYLSQGLDNAWYLAWFAPAPLLWLAYGKTPAWQLMAASVVGLLSSAIYILQCYSMLPLVIILPGLTLQTILFSASIWLARWVDRRCSSIVALFAFPVCWTAFEFLSELVSPNGTYGSFAYSQMSAPVLIQSVSLFGLYAITFLICLFANTLAMTFRANRRNVVAIGLGLAICAANVGFGLLRLAALQPESVRVAAMVDESAMVESWHVRTLAQAVAVTQAYASAARKAAAEGATFAVTPEGGIAAEPRLRSAILAPLVAASRQTGIRIVAGVVERDPAADIAFWIRPTGPIQRYDKRHPVPGLEDQFRAGHASGWLGHGCAMEICKDMDFPRTIRLDAMDGVRLMGTPAGDFGKDAWLHARMAIMRGVENGFALVRAANEGLVTASDAEGRLIASKMDTPKGLTMIIADLPLGPGPTLYTRIGYVFPLACVVLMCLIGAVSLKRGPRL